MITLRETLAGRPPHVVPAARDGNHAQQSTGQRAVALAEQPHERRLVWLAARAERGPDRRNGKRVGDSGELLRSFNSALGVVEPASPFDEERLPDAVGLLPRLGVRP